MAKRGYKRSQRSQRSSVLKNSVDIWAVQCKSCSKWRIIPTQEEYEEIRRKLTEDPFECEKKQKSCEEPSDLDNYKKGVWVFDKPDLPKTPTGFQRGLVLRKDYSKMDCYYITPNGKKLRASTEVAAFLAEHPEYENVSVSDFSFSTPKIGAEATNQNVGGKEASGSQADRE